MPGFVINPAPNFQTTGCSIRVSALFPENCLTVSYDEFVRAPNSMAVQLEKLVGFRVELPEQAVRSDQGVSESFQKFMAASDAS